MPQKRQTRYLENSPICDRLTGRISYLLMRGRVKDPEIMQSASEALTNLIDACQCLLDDLGTPEDGVQANLMARCQQIINTAKGQ